MKLSFYILLLFIFVGNIFPQTDEQKRWLLDFSKEQSEIWQINRIIAESIAVKNNLPIRQEYPDGSIIELQRFEDGIPIYHITNNLASAKTISSDKLWIDNSLGIFSLSGQGQTIGLWEVGGVPLSTHQELVGRAFLMDNGGSTSQHATHVAGTLIASGVNPNAKGMSNQGQVNYYNSGNDLSEVAAAAANGLRVTNHSYGLITGWRFDYYGDNRWVWFGNVNISPTEDYRFGLYTSSSAGWDNVLNNAPNVLVVSSAGNDRGDGPSPGTPHWLFGNTTTLYTDVRDIDGGADGYDCMNDPIGIAKNSLAVGAVLKISNGYTNPGDVIMSTFSNWGPTDDGRIKPDIVAAGVNLNSSSNSSNTSYATLSGTSMASPSVAGSIGLLLELQQTLNGSVPLRSSTLKGLLLHTADEAGDFPGPDYKFGWGLMNTFKAAQIMKLDNETGGNTLIKEETLNNGIPYEIQVQSLGTEPLKVTICWIDPPGTPAPPSLNPTNLMLKNDLDIRITGPNAITYFPWILDPSNPSAQALTGDNFRDNVEQIFIENTVAGTYTIQINHKNTLINNSQNFSMIMSGIAVPVPGSVSLISPATGSTGLPVDITFSWTLSERTTSYNLQISTDAGFTNVVYDNDSLYGLSEQVTLAGLQQYYWRVRGKNSGGYGAWSSVWNFTTMVAPPGIPQLIYPEDGAVNVPLNPVFNWSGFGIVDKYWLQVGNNALYTTLFVSDSTITDTLFQSDPLEDGKRYYWRVKGINSAGSSNFSPSNIFISELLAPDSLTAVLTSPNSVMLTWRDNSSNETKYYILRKSEGGDYSIIDSLTGADYTNYTDSSLTQGVIYYRVFVTNSIAQSDTSNEASVTVVSVDEKDQIPTEYGLSQNYPNPFNPATSIEFALPFPSDVKLIIYNALGETILTLLEKSLPSGYHKVNWNTRDQFGNMLSSGIYFYQLKAKNNDGENFSQTKKMILIK